MELTVRADNEGKWGFVERFKPYAWKDYRCVTVDVGVTSEGNFTEPYALRGTGFEKLSVVADEMGLEKYMKARKPIYSLLSDGFIIDIRSYFEYESGEYCEEKSHYHIYSIRDIIRSKPTEGKAYLVEVMEIPEELDALAKKLSKKVAETGFDRNAFLKARF